MDETIDYHTKWSKPYRENHISLDIVFMWYLNKWYKWVYTQNGKRFTDRENSYQRGKGEGTN